MESHKTCTKFFVAAILFALAVELGPDTWASPPGAGDDQPPAVTELTGSYVPGNDPFADKPTPAVQTQKLVNVINPKLIGTITADGGHSYAVFQSGGQSVLVREGNEISEGLLLVKVEWGHVIAGRDGNLQKIRIGSGEVGQSGVRSIEEMQALRIKARSRVRFLSNMAWRQ